MQTNIPALATAFLATWQPDASPLLRAALIDLLTSVRDAERERVLDLADQVFGEMVGWSPAVNARLRELARRVLDLPPQAAPPTRHDRTPD